MQGLIAISPCTFLLLTMIKLSNATKIYEGSTKAVDRISFEVKEGETFGLVGTSGCGKTTTLKMINRLVKPDSGHISINGKAIDNQAEEELRRQIGYVIQSVGLFPHYSIKENIATVPRLLKWDEQRIWNRSHELLNMVGLAPDQYADRMPHALSGGQQQRVGLARALAGDPAILLMDEPFGALDPITKEQLRDEFKKLLNQISKTIILVTHDVVEAFDLCDRICLMDQGRLQQVGSPRELLFTPANNFVHSFFASHRFQLEMMSITIGDILDVTETDDSELNLTSDRDSISLTQNLYDVFKYDGSEIEEYKILNSDGEVVSVITAGQLLEGFQQLRQKLKEGSYD